jgi:cell division protein FtsW
VICMLVMLGDDLGTTFVLLTIFLALLWVVGTPGRLFVGVLGLMALVMLMLVIVAPYRLERLTSFMNPSASPVGVNMQSIQGKYAIGSGGWFGVGLGASRQKWGWVPNATTDYIFAIIGEELGLVGTLCVSALYGALAYAGLRIARRVDDVFMRLAAAGATAWIVVQAVVNIGAVIGVFPITGVPLPLVSYGVSSLLTTMVALGMLMSFAKREPGAREALATRDPGGLRRVLSWLGLSPGRA